MTETNIQSFIVFLLIFASVFIIWDRREPVVAHMIAWLLVLLMTFGLALNYIKTGTFDLIREMWPLWIGITVSIPVTAIFNSIFVPYTHTEEYRDRLRAERENRERDELRRLQQKYREQSDD